jgi:LysM repeat protein
MKRRKLASVAILAVGVLGGGCANHKKPQSKVPLEPGVTEIGPGKAHPASAVPPDPSFVSVPAGAAQPKFVPVDVPPPVPSAMPAPVPASMFTPAAEAAAPKAPVAPAPSTQTPVVPAAAPAPVAAPAGGPSQKYLVQKGDTLFRIAKTKYGDGNRWQQIASANPGLTPASLKAGSTIVVP